MLLVKVSKDLIELCLHFLNLDVLVFFCRASFPVILDIPVILIHSLYPSKLLMAMIVFVIAIAIIGVDVLILSLSGCVGVFCNHFFISLLP